MDSFTISLVESLKHGNLEQCDILCCVFWPVFKCLHSWKLVEVIFWSFQTMFFATFFLFSDQKNRKNKWNNSVLAIESQVQDTLSSVYIFLSIIRWRKIRGKFWLPCRPTWTSNIVEWMFPIWVYFLRPILTVSSEKYWRNW